MGTGATLRTQVGILGAGPAGLVLAHLLAAEGIDAVVLERRSRSYLESRVRAGVLEHNTAELLTEMGLGDRMRAEGMVHRGLFLRYGGVSHRIDMHALTGGRAITVYGQQEVEKDLIAARLAGDGPLLFEAEAVELSGLDTDSPTVHFVHEQRPTELRCEVIAGCDGFHGLSRAAIPARASRVFERVYPFSWLGILAQAPPAADELVYTGHERGFALHSMRSKDITRLYLQVPTHTDIADWSDARIWDELRVRLAAGTDFPLADGPILERGVTPMRSFVVEPMRHGRLFLAGDAAHIVPPTGAKGLNLAVADVRRLAEALAAFFHGGRTALLDAYSDACLRRIWRVQHFSWWMTMMLHRLDDDPVSRRLQLSQLEYVTSSPAAATSLAENYAGLPWD